MSRDTYHSEARVVATLIATGQIPEGISEELFANPDLCNLFALACDCRETMGALSAVVLADWLHAERGIDMRDWIADFTAAERLQNPDLLPSYLGLLAGAREEEALKGTLDALAKMPTSDPVEARERALAELNRLEIGRRRARIVPLADYLPATLDAIQERFQRRGIPGIPTGLPSLDRFTGGWQASDLTLLAARPAVGKTALALNFALTAARAGKRVTLISAEQPAEQIIHRLVSLIGAVPAWKLRSPTELLEREWAALTPAFGELKALPIAIMDESAPTLAHIAHHVRLVPADLILVDYVQRLKVPGAATLYDRVSAVAQGLKELARSLSVAVVALAQINRAGVGGARMEHLKGSGDLEQEADAVMILDRQDDAGTASLTLEKNRHGATGAIDLVFSPQQMRFGELVRDEPGRGGKRYDDDGAF